MRPVKNTSPTYTILYQPGTKVRWIYHGKAVSTNPLTIIAHVTCPNHECNECDKMSYLMNDRIARCHFRPPSSTCGLCYWEKAD